MLQKVADRTKYIRIRTWTHIFRSVWRRIFVACCSWSEFGFGFCFSHVFYFVFVFCVFYTGQMTDDRWDDRDRGQGRTDDTRQTVYRRTGQCIFGINVLLLCCCLVPYECSEHVYIHSFSSVNVNMQLIVLLLVALVASASAFAPRTFARPQTAIVRLSIQSHPLMIS